MDSTDALDEVLATSQAFRAELEPHFGPDTAAGDWQDDDVPAAGQCAAVSALVHELLADRMDVDADVACASADVEGASHWFNRVTVGEASLDLDLTGDQFGLPPVQAVGADRLYGGTRVRSFDELNQETRDRAQLLADRAGLAIEIPDAPSRGRGR